MLNVFGHSGAEGEFILEKRGQRATTTPQMWPPVAAIDWPPANLIDDAGRLAYARQ